MKKFISGILVAAMLVGCLMVLPFGAFAYENGETPADLYLPYDTSGKTASLALTQTYSSAQEKLDEDENMRLWVVYDKYELYANAYTGEVYVKDTSTGEILTTNPYDSTGAGMSSVAPAEFMSQLVLQYSSTSDATGKTTKLYSYTEAAARGQISIEPIQNGIRVNYIIGDTTKRYLLPASIPAIQMVEEVLAPAMEQVEQRIRQVGEENGVPEEQLNSTTWDFQMFCTAFQPTFSVADLLGKEYTYGNFIAFEKWYSNVDAAYTAFYDSKTKEEQASMSPTNIITNITNDYRALYQVYTFICPYFYDIGKTGGSIYRENWGIIYDRLGMDDDGNELPEEKWVQDYAATVEYLRSGAYEDENGNIVYPNSYFGLDQTVWTNSTKMQMYESIFLSYISNFTEDDMYEAEETVGLSMPAANNAIFRVSLEYVLDGSGVTVTMPSSGIIYDESQYIVEYIDVLPYLGSAKVQEGGYIFYPDGSGAIVDLNDFQTSASSISGKVYGQDYAYYSISGKHQQTIALPVFGVVKNENTYYMVDPHTGVQVPVTEAIYRRGTYTITYTYHEDAEGVNHVYAQYPYGYEQIVEYICGTRTRFETSADQKNSENYYGNVTYVVSGSDAFGISTSKTAGFLAILEDGASLATINVRVNDAGNYSRPYTAVYAEYVPRPSDKYNLADVMTGADSSSFNIQAKGKYTGEYTIRYILLTDGANAAAHGVTEYYPTSYVGMAAAYQDYLVDAGVLTALTNLQSDLPLYIESFGVIQTLEKYLSIPFTVDAPLTTFEDIQTMYGELEAMGVTNIKFRLSGFANGGFESTLYPVTVKWEKAAGGKSGFKKLLTFVSEQDTGLEIFPNFDFLYTRSLKGIKLKDIGARSVDNRYAWHQSYSAVYQQYTNQGGIVISTGQIEPLFAKFLKKYSKYEIASLSLEGMAGELSSNFDEDNFIDREGSLENITAFLSGVREAGYTSLMSTGGNAYALQYMDYLLEAPLESSYFNAASYSVPFWGMVVHGFLQYAGEPFNEQANQSEALLRAIESGASLYFLLSYQNTQLLKDSSKSDYYSVSYEISRDSAVEYYQLLNATIGDLQTYRIVNHQGIAAERVHLESEIAEQVEQLEEEFFEALESTVSRQIEAEKALILATINLQVDWTLGYDQGGNRTASAAIVAYLDTYGDYATLREILGPESDYTGTAAENYSAKWTKLVAAVSDGSLVSEYGKSIGVIFDTDAILSAAKAALYTDTLNADFQSRLLAYMETTANADADVVATVSDVPYTSAYSFFTLSDALDEDYVSTTSTIDDYSVVLVTYSNGTDTVRFLLNFNIFKVTVRLDGETYTLDKYGFKRID